MSTHALWSIFYIQVLHLEFKQAEGASYQCIQIPARKMWWRSSQTTLNSIPCKDRANGHKSKYRKLKGKPCCCWWWPNRVVTGWSERVGTLQPWRYAKPNWTHSQGTYSIWPCFELEWLISRGLCQSQSFFVILYTTSEREDSVRRNKLQRGKFFSQGSLCSPLTGTMQWHTDRTHPLAETTNIK